MIVGSLLDAVVDRQLGRIVRDAEALLAVAAHSDLPGGLAILPVAATGLLGFSLGSGHRLAAAHGCRQPVAVAVQASKWVRDALAVDSADLEDGLWHAARLVEYVAAHELAHALSSEIDQRIATDREAASLAALTKAGRIERASDATWLAHHDAAWAGGLAILVARCSRLRVGAGPQFAALAEADFRAHGLDYGAIATAVKSVADDEPLRPLLNSTAAIQPIRAMLPPDEQRWQAIEPNKRRELPVAGAEVSIPAA